MEEENAEADGSASASSGSAKWGVTNANLGRYVKAAACDCSRAVRG